MKATVEVEVISKYTHYDDEIESAVLGAILLEKNCLINIMGLLNEDIFYLPENRFLYRTIIWMWDKGWAIDMLTITHFIYEKGIEKWDKVSTDNPAYYITRLTNAVVSTANIEAHCLILRQLYIKRLLHEAKYSNEEKDSLDAAFETKKKIEEAFNIGAVDSWLSLEEVITTKLYKRMEEPDGYNIIETSFQKLNNVAPIECGDYIILGARPSIGKTACAMQMAGDIAFKGNSVGVISLETKGEKLAARMLAAQSKIEFWRVWRNKMSDYQHEIFHTKALQLSSLPIFIYDKPTVTHTDIRIAANKLRRKVKGNLVIFLDYIQLVSPGENNRKERRLQVQEISRTLKLICMELENTSIIALAQLNRDASKEPPRMHHLKEAGDLEQDAEKIWLLHRDRDKEEEQKGQGITTFDASLFIEKNKEGWTGEIDLLFEAEQMTFREKGSDMHIHTYKEPPTNYYEKENENPF